MEAMAVSAPAAAPESETLAVATGVQAANLGWAALGAAHRKRLGEVWRSAGWPCHDVLELDLLAVGALSRHWDGHGRETLRLTDAGISWLATVRRRCQAARGAHEALVERVAVEMQRAGRVVWRGLSLRAPLPRPDDVSTVRWVVAMPDVFSIRHTTVEDRVEPIVHEIKVSRADLLSDLRRSDKAAAYLALASQCWYVLREGIASAAEVPPAYGVIVARCDGLHVERAAPQRAMRLPFAVWMALARATAVPAAEEPAQALLDDCARTPECSPGCAA
jgi:hypothetical protein